MKSPRLAFVLLWPAVGCATQRPTPRLTPGEDLAGARTALERPSSAIGRVELNAMSGLTAAEAIRRLRPQFLQGFQPPALNGQRIYPSVYIENRPFAGLETLSGVPVTALDEVRFLRPPEAKDVYGSGCSCEGGVIVLRMRRNTAPSGAPPRG